MLTDYWRQTDPQTGETWLSFAQRTGMDAVSIAYGQAWQDHLIKAPRKPITTAETISPPTAPLVPSRI